MTKRNQFSQHKMLTGVGTPPHETVNQGVLKDTALVPILYLKLKWNGLNPK